MPVTQVEVRDFLFAMPPRDRLEIARDLLESVRDDEEYWQLDDDFAAEIQRRREEMRRGEQIVPNWRETMDEIRRTLESGGPL